MVLVKIGVLMVGGKSGWHSEDLKKKPRKIPENTRQSAQANASGQTQTRHVTETGGSDHVILYDDVEEAPDSLIVNLGALLSA